MTIKQVTMFGGAAVLLAMMVWLAAPARAKIGISQSQMPTLWVDATSQQAQEDGTPATPFKTVAKALANAKKATLVLVKSGEYRENIVLRNGITLKGETHPSTPAERPVLRAANSKKPAVVMRDEAVLEFFRVTGGFNGIRVEVNANVKGATANRVEIVKNIIRANARYGIGGVDQETEELKEGLIIQGVVLENNNVEKNRKAQIAGLAMANNQ